MKKLLLIMLLILVSVPIVLSLEQTQQTNKIFLDPFYRQSMDPDLDYNYTITINPPAGITSVQSAIVTFQMWLNPTIEFFLLVDGQQCNTPSYEVHTTYANAGEGTIFFDCSNIINKEGDYMVTLTPDDDTGAVTGWVDITYADNQSDFIGGVGNVDTVGSVSKITEPDMEMHGTEYFSDEPVKIWLQLLNGNNSPIDQAVCYLWVYNPANSLYITRANMYFVDEGIYAYDFDAPFIGGVYPSISECYFTATQEYHNATGFTPYVYSSVINDYTATHVLDIVDHQIKETGSNPKRVSFEYNFDNLCHNVNPDILTGFSVGINIKWQSSIDDNLYLWWWNWTDDSWNQFPNSINYDTDRLLVSNSIETNNLTRDGYTNETGGFRLFINDTTHNDAGSSIVYIDYLFTSCDSLANPQWEELKGSSEVHVTLDESTITGFLLEETTIELVLDTGYEGNIEINFTTFSRTLEPKEIEHKYDLPAELTCEDIVYFAIEEDNGTWNKYYYADINITNSEFICKRSTTNSELISIIWDRTVNYNDIHDYSIVMDNRLERNVREFTANVNYYYNDFENACIGYLYENGLGSKPSLPLVNIPDYNDTFANGCAHFWNTYYYFNLSSVECERVGSEVSNERSFRLYEEHYYRMKQFYELMINDFIIGSNSLILFSEYPVTSAYINTTHGYWYGKGANSQNYNFLTNNMSEYVWVHEERTLTNATNIAPDIWGTNSTINPGILSQIVSSVWSYIARYIHGEII